MAVRQIIQQHRAKVGLDMAQAIVLRGERVVVRAVSVGMVENRWIPRLNRFSSLCYVLARCEDGLDAGIPPIFSVNQFPDENAGIFQ